MSSNQELDHIFIVDHVLANSRIDMLENCEALTNLVIPDTVLRYLNRKNI